MTLPSASRIKWVFAAVPILSLLLGLLNTPSSLATPQGINGKIIFDDLNNSYHDFYIVNPDGTDRTKVSDMSDQQYVAADAQWSPSGSHFFYQNANWEQGRGIYMRDSNGTNEQLITTVSQSYGADGYSWSPDNSVLAVADNENGCLCLENIATGDYISIFNGNQVSSPSWSPDGTKIAFYYNHSIYVFDIYSWSSSIIATTGVQSFPYDWSPDSSRLLFGAYTDMQSGQFSQSGPNVELRLYTIDTDGNNLTPFDTFTGLRPAHYIYDAAWSPDGQKIVYSEYITDTSMRIRVVDGETYEDPTETIADTTSQSKVSWQSLPETKPTYRFWSNAYQHHFYTANFAEAINVMIGYSNDTWNYEGTAYNIPSDCSSATSVYRFWSNKYKGHFYTVSDAEKQAVINNYSDDVWRYEGVVYCAYDQMASDRLPVYRFWSNKNKGHFYTTNDVEKQAVIDNYPDDVWRYEGIAYYVSQ